MQDLDEALRRLPDRHRLALLWFDVRAGRNVSWPTPLPDGTLLVSKVRGIYKPKWSEYALSVRTALTGPYPDEETAISQDDTWSFGYYQEGIEPQLRDRKFTNRGLMQCQRDSVPVGVLRQISGSPNSRYRILGLALVAGWEDGFFWLKSMSGAPQDRQVDSEG